MLPRAIRPAQRREAGVRLVVEHILEDVLLRSNTELTEIRAEQCLNASCAAGREIR